MTAIDKNLLIAALERALWEAQFVAGVTSLADIDTNLNNLRAAYTHNPATITGAMLTTAAAQVQAVKFTTLRDVSGIFQKARE